MEAVDDGFDAGVGVFEKMRESLRAQNGFTGRMKVAGDTSASSTLPCSKSCHGQRSQPKSRHRAMPDESTRSRQRKTATGRRTGLPERSGKPGLFRWGKPVAELTDRSGDRQACDRDVQGKAPEVGPHPQDEGRDWPRGCGLSFSRLSGAILVMGSTRESRLAQPEDSTHYVDYWSGK